MAGIQLIGKFRSPIRGSISDIGNATEQQIEDCSMMILTEQVTVNNVQSLLPLIERATQFNKEIKFSVQYNPELFQQLSELPNNHKLNVIVQNDDKNMQWSLENVKGWQIDIPLVVRKYST